MQRTWSKRTFFILLQTDGQAKCHWTSVAGYILRLFTRLQTHPSTTFDWHRSCTLTETNMLRLLPRYLTVSQLELHNLRKRCFCRQENVFWLQVAVDNVTRMKMLQRNENLQSLSLLLLLSLDHKIQCHKCQCQMKQCLLMHSNTDLTIENWSI